MAPTRTPSPVSARLRAATEQEQMLLARARRGEEVRNDLILHLQPSVKRLATRLYHRLSPHTRAEKCLEMSDLVQSANVHMLAQFAVALTKENPCTWLLKVARYTMADLLNGRGGLIRQHPDAPPIVLLRLDRPLSHDNEGVPLTLADLLPSDLRLPAPDAQQAFESVARALAGLPDKQRLVIERHFGFAEYAPCSLNQISRDLSPTGSMRARLAHRHYQLALLALRQALAPSFPQLTTTGGAQ